MVRTLVLALALAPGAGAFAQPAVMPQVGTPQAASPPGDTTLLDDRNHMARPSRATHGQARTSSGHAPARAASSPPDDQAASPPEK